VMGKKRGADRFGSKGHAKNPPSWRLFVMPFAPSLAV